MKAATTQFSVLLMLLSNFTFLVVLLKNCFIFILDKSPP